LTPLEHAARGGHLEIMKLLLDAGAKVDEKDEKRLMYLKLVKDPGGSYHEKELVILHLELCANSCF
jgi:hypothetical protein